MYGVLGLLPWPLWGIAHTGVPQKFVWHPIGRESCPGGRLPPSFIHQVIIINGLNQICSQYEDGLKLGAHYTTLYDQLLSCSYSQLQTYDWLAHTIQLFCWVVHSFHFLQRVHNVTIVRHHNHYLLWLVLLSNNSSTSHYVLRLVALSDSRPTRGQLLCEGAHFTTVVSDSFFFHFFSYIHFFIHATYDRKLRRA